MGQAGQVTPTLATISSPSSRLRSLTDLLYSTVTYPNPLSPSKIQYVFQLRGPGQAPRCLSLSYFSLRRLKGMLGFHAQDCTFPMGVTEQKMCKFHKFFYLFLFFTSLDYSVPNFSTLIKKMLLFLNGSW